MNELNVLLLLIYYGFDMSANSPSIITICVLVNKWFENTLRGFISALCMNVMNAAGLNLINLSGRMLP